MNFNNGKVSTVLGIYKAKEDARQDFETYVRAMLAGRWSQVGVRIGLDGSITADVAGAILRLSPRGRTCA